MNDEEGSCVFHGKLDTDSTANQTATAISCSIAERTPQGYRGQGLFVARTYMAKMGGTISARNVEGGVSFLLTLQQVRSGQVR